MKVFQCITLSLVGLLFMPACNAKTADTSADTLCINLPTAAVEALGTDVCRLLLEADTVTAYTLTGKVNPDSTETVICPDGFVRDSLSCPVDSSMLAVLHFVLLADSSNYVMDSTRIIRSPYIPVLELEFKSKGKMASVLFSMTDCTWTVIRQKEELFRCTYADPRAVSRFCLYYIKKMKHDNSKK